MSNSDDNKLIHSDAAISVTHNFYNKKFMIYVEGPDDIIFWDDVFSDVVSSEDYELTDVGGKEQFTIYINKLKAGQIKNVIIACDKDYTNYMDKNPYNHPLIITSYGYSIENSMFCPYRIANYIKTLARNRHNYLVEINDWYNQFCSDAISLLPYDIVNYIHHDIGISCFGDNCCRFLLSNQSAQLDKHKIRAHIDSIKNKFPTIEMNTIADKIAADNREYRYIIKGHFITHAVINLIKQKVQTNTFQKVTLSNDAIYAEFVHCRRQCKDICQDRQYLFTTIENALSNLS